MTEYSILTGFVAVGLISTALEFGGGVRDSFDVAVDVISGTRVEAGVVSEDQGETDQADASSSTDDGSQTVNGSHNGGDEEIIRIRARVPRR